LTDARLAAIVADVQPILWKESRMLPDFPREYGDYWRYRGRDRRRVDRLEPPDFTPVDLAERVVPTVIDANELLWAARVLAILVRVHRNVIPAVRQNVNLAEAILASYADVPDFDPREQR
jgi:hypothetical protein